MSTRGTVVGIIANLVTIEVDGPVGQNEICYIDLHGSRLMAEVIKVGGSNAYVQVFESTRGLYVGCSAEFTGHMLEVTMGPGMLSRNYDGLQNNLNTMKSIFLSRGEYTPSLDSAARWKFEPLVKSGDTVQAADWLGSVRENWIDHKIMVPFSFKGTAKISWVASPGEYTVKDAIVKARDSEGTEHSFTMTMTWPVKMEIRAYKNKPRPF